MPVTLAEMEALIGRQFPGGKVSVPRWQSFLLTDVMCFPQLDENMIHPAAAFNIPLDGMGMTYQELFDLCHAESPDAVRAGEYDFQFHDQLREETEYQVQGEIVDVRRKTGARSGTFDLVTFELRLSDPDGRATLTATNTWVFMRSET